MLSMDDLFHRYTSVTLSPPATLGQHIVSHAMSAFLLLYASRFHKNPLHIDSTVCKISRRMRNICVQKAYIEARTLFINWSLLAYDRNLTVHVLIFPTILSNNGWHWLRDKFFELSGTPRYLKGRVPLVKPVYINILCWMGSGTPPKYTKLLARSPDTLENCWKHSNNSAVDGMSPLQNNKRSLQSLVGIFVVFYISDGTWTHSYFSVISIVL